MKVRCANADCTHPGEIHEADARCCGWCGEVLPHRAILEQLRECQAAHEVLTRWIKGESNTQAQLQSAWATLVDAPVYVLEIVLDADLQGICGTMHDLSEKLNTAFFALSIG